MMNFRRIFESLGPGWLTSADGAKVLYSVGVILDATLEKMRQSLHARLPSYTETEDSLGYLGRDRLVIRGRNEPAARYASRLVEWRYPLGHRVRGSAFGMLRQIRAYFLDAAVQFTVDRRGNLYTIEPNGDESKTSVNFYGGEDLDLSHWSRFWVGLIGTGWQHAEAGPLIGDDDLWGGVLTDDSEYVIGVEGATQSDIQALRQIANEWKMAGTQQERLIVSMFDVNNDDPSSLAENVDVSWYAFGGDELARNQANAVVIPL